MAFKVGDKVRVLATSTFEGRIGEVIRISLTGYYIIQISNIQIGLIDSELRHVN